MLFGALDDGGLAVLNGSDPAVSTLAGELAGREVMFCAGDELAELPRSVIDRVLNARGDSTRRVPLRFFVNGVAIR